MAKRETLAESMRRLSDIVEDHTESDCPEWFNILRDYVQENPPPSVFDQPDMQSRWDPLGYLGLSVDSTCDAARAITRQEWQAANQKVSAFIDEIQGGGNRDLILAVMKWFRVSPFRRVWKRAYSSWQSEQNNTRSRSSNQYTASDIDLLPSKDEMTLSH